MKSYYIKPTKPLSDESVAFRALAVAVAGAITMVRISLALTALIITRIFHA